MYLSVLNDVADQDGLPESSFSKSRADAYTPWAKPVIPDRQLDALVDSQLYACAHDQLTNTLRSEEAYRQRNRKSDIIAEGAGFKVNVSALSHYTDISVKDILQCFVPDRQ